MPTGYTYNVMNGEVSDFPTWAMQCARAFGALILMRDDPMDAPIPDKFEPSDYSAKALAAAKAEMSRLQAMTPEQVKAACEAERAERVAARQKYDAKDAEENARLDAMLAQVEAWEPPSGNHVEMKNFMREQLRMSRNDLSLRDKYDPIKEQTPSDWLRDKLDKAQKDIGYHAAEHEKEVARADGRTLWVQQLRASLATKRAA